MTRFYIMPTIGDGTESSIRQPKYGADELKGLRVRYFGFEDFCIIRANPTDEQHDLLVSRPDVRALPQDLSQQINQTVADMISTFLENHGMSGNWVAPTMTYKMILRNVLKYMKLMEIYNLYDERRKFLTQSTLDLTFGSIPLAIKNKVLQVAQHFGVPSLDDSLTIRAVLNIIAQRIPLQEIHEENFLG